MIQKATVHVGIPMKTIASTLAGAYTKTVTVISSVNPYGNPIKDENK